MDQRSPEWYQARLGRITGTRFAAAMAGPGSRAYASLIDELVSERLTGHRRSIPTTPAMQWGIDHEPAARAWYSRQSGNHVELVGFVHHRKFAFVGVSPDGLVGSSGVLEIKCPQVKAYRETVTRGCVPTRYVWQVQGQLWVCEREYADFVCFHPGMGGLVIRVPRDEAGIARLQARCQQVEREVERRITARSGRPVPVSVTTSDRPPAQQPAPSCPWPREQPAKVSGSQTKPSLRFGISKLPWWVWVIAAATLLYWLTH